MIRAFTENEVKPIAAEIDRTHEFPAENIRKLFRLRVISMTAPREYGGAGSDQLSAAICAEERAKACAVSFASLFPNEISSRSALVRGEWALER